MIKKIIPSLLFVFFYSTLEAQQNENIFNVVAFYTALHEPPHISFVNDANKWFQEKSALYHFRYDTTSNLENINTSFLGKYQVVLFLDTRPELPAQRNAFQKYMDSGGAWMGFHFAGFALTPSAYNQDWNWYHETFLGSGQYKSNTWKPTTAYLRVEENKHPTTKKLPPIFKSAPNEWYRWENDLRKNKKIKILLSIDTTSFPLGTGPKPNEIWHTGYYPVAWTNTQYKMIYFNIGHDDFNFDTKQPLSSSFSSEKQNEFILNCLFWLGNKKKRE